MKLNNIAYAVSISLAALALTACGNSGKKSSTPQTKPQTQQPAQPTAEDKAKAAAITALEKAAVEQKLTTLDAKEFAQKAYAKKVKPGTPEFDKAIADFKKEKEEAAKNAGKNDVVADEIVKANPFISGFDSSKLTSVNSSHYMRDKKSNYDRHANPESENTASSGDTITPTLNIQNPYLTNYLIGIEGEVVNGKAIPWAIDYTGEYVDPTDAANPIEQNKKHLKETVGEYTTISIDNKESTYKLPALNLRNTIQEENKGVNGITVVGQPLAILDTANHRIKAGDVGGRSGLLGYRADVSTLGRVSVETKPYFGAEENPTVDTTPTRNELTTRVFGKNYRDLESGSSAVYHVSHKGNNYQKTNNSYVASYNEKKILTKFGEAKLEHVQYGRLTANIDALVEDPNDKDHKVDDLIYRPFKKHGDDATVDVYFYRGTDQTTKAEMEAVKKKGGQLSYLGHALTYGVDPLTLNTNDTYLPNSFGKSSRLETLGNFVEAVYDVDKDTVKGSIYNFVNRHTDANSKFEKQPLIDFQGDVHLNTVIGTSKRLQDNDKGNFRASFYGAGAKELGGNVSSVEKGFAEGKWGGVFGAQLTTAPVQRGGINFNLNTTGAGTQNTGKSN